MKYLNKILAWWLMKKSKAVDVDRLVLDILTKRGYVMNTNYWIKDFVLVKLQNDKICIKHDCNNGRWLEFNKNEIVMLLISLSNYERI